MSRQDRATIRDIRSLQSTMDRQARSIGAATQEDVVCDNNRRLMLRSPNGHFWAIIVDDAGGLSTVDMGITAL